MEKLPTEKDEELKRLFVLCSLPMLAAFFP